MDGQRLAGLVLAAVTVAVAGCGEKADSSGDSARAASPVELVAIARSPIPDLPVPLGFDLDQRISRNLAAAGIRWVDHLYKGGSDKFAVARFYRRQMPLQRWTLVTEMFTKGDMKLDFEKQNERCHITVSDGDLWHATFIRAELWTAGRVPASPKEGNP